MTHQFAQLPQSKAHRTKRGTCPSITWPVCKRCGLVLLLNDASARAARRACEGAEDRP